MPATCDAQATSLCFACSAHSAARSCLRTLRVLRSLFLLRTVSSGKVRRKPFRDRQVRAAPLGGFDDVRIFIDIVEPLDQDEIGSWTDRLQASLKAQSILSGNGRPRRAAGGAVVTRHDVADAQTIP